MDVKLTRNLSVNVNQEAAIAHVLTEREFEGSAAMETQVRFDG